MGNYTFVWRGLPSTIIADIQIRCVYVIRAHRTVSAGVKPSSQGSISVSVSAHNSIWSAFLLGVHTAVMSAISHILQGEKTVIYSDQYGTIQLLN